MSDAKVVLTDQIATLFKAYRYVENWRVAVDIGAHYGHWTQAMAERFETVHAFEPQPDNFRVLRRATEALGNVTAHKTALMDYRGRGRMKTPPGRETFSASRYLDANWDDGETEIAMLDDYGLVDVDLLKVDVEGAEALMLMGGKDTILRCRPLIIVEFSAHGKRYGLLGRRLKWVLRHLGYIETLKCPPDRVYRPAA